MKNIKFKKNFKGQYSENETKHEKSVISAERFEEIEHLVEKEMLADIAFNQGTHIVEFLKSRPFISVNQVEKAAGMPKSSLASAMIGKRSIPTKYWYVLHNILFNYGYTIDNPVKCDPPFDLYLNFKNLEINVHESGIYFSKNYEEVKDLEIFLNHVLIALEKRQESEVTKYGKEFCLNSRLVESWN